MKVLITGGCGLIGHNVVSRFENLGHTVEVIDNLNSYGLVPEHELDYLHNERRKKFTSTVWRTCITSPETLQIFQKFQPDVVVHLASYPRQKAVNVDPVKASNIMIAGLTNILECCRMTGVGRVTFLSSSMVYGDFENYVKEDYTCKPQGLYGIFKLAGESIVKDYFRKWGLRYTIIRPSAVYGELDASDRVIGKFLLSAIAGKVLTVNGANETLDFTYVDDAADGIVSATISQNTLEKTYNITKSHSTSLLQAAELAVKIAGSGSIECADRDVDFPSRGALDITSAKQDFSFNPQIDVEQGFYRYYCWLTSSYFWRSRAI